MKSPRWRMLMCIALVLSLFGVGIVGLLVRDMDERITGDVPNILIVMHSLIADGDADLLNNFENGDNVDILGWAFPPQYYPGTTYPLRSIGLPLLLMPGWLMGHVIGVVVWGIFLHALTCGALAWISMHMTGQIRLSLLFGVSVYGMVPFFFYQYYPYVDQYGGLATLALFLILSFRIAGQSGRWGWSAAAVVIASLAPWLHFKFLILPPLVYVLLWVANWRNPWRARLSIMGMVTVLFTALMLGFLGYHTSRGMYLSNYFILSHPLEEKWRGLLGVIFDQQYGVFYYSPVLAVAFMGIMKSLIRGSRHVALFGLALIVPLWIFTSTHFYWWGGACPMGRMQMTWLYTAIFFAVIYLQGETSQGWIALFTVLALISLMNTMAIMASSGAHFMFGSFPNHYVRPIPGEQEWWGVSLLFHRYGINEYLPSIIFLEGKSIRVMMLTVNAMLILAVIHNWEYLHRARCLRQWRLALCILLWIGLNGASYLFLHEHRNSSREEHFFRIYGAHPAEFDYSR